MSDLERFVEPIAGFSAKPAPYMIEVFAWYLHEVKRKDRFQTGDIGPLFDAIHVTRPANIPQAIARLCEKKPPRLIKDGQGLRLHQDARRELSVRLPQRATSVATTQLLDSLLGRVTDASQKTFLTETIACFKHAAYRAAIVMAWNLAFSHVLDRIVASHLTEFNRGVGTNGMKKAITRRADFQNMQESDIVTIARAQGVLSRESAKILKEKLDKRNTAAHPSTVVVTVATAEEVISDLVQNIVLATAL